MTKIADWYVEWANTLDSAGTDSSKVKERMNIVTLNEVMVRLFTTTRAGRSISQLKKHIFYGKEKLYLGEAHSYHLTAEDIARVEALKDRATSHENIRFLHAVLGKIDEACELAQAYIVHVIEGKPIDVNNIREEIGDSQWYDALIAKYLGDPTFEKIQEANYRKLITRYPEGKWNQDRALNRDLDKEKEALRGQE